MKTIICDIDGTLLDYQHDTIPHSGHTRDHTALPGVVKKMRQWEVQGCRIIIITGRRESERARTEKDLRYHNIPYDMLIMGFADTGRVLINDVGGKGECKAHAVSLPRDQGFDEFDWKEVGL
tara:strand:+ start:224 stop:589 length:366 start_codon:yes stop_codon:yes gene_type:complete